MRARNRKIPLIELNEGLSQVREEVDFRYGPIFRVIENTFVEKRLARLIIIARKAGILAERRNTAIIRNDSR